MRRLGTAAGVWIAVILAAGCNKKDNSEDTDQAGEELRSAQGHVQSDREALNANQDAIVKQQRDLVREQQELADRQGLLDHQREQLGSAHVTLQAARAAYVIATTERFAKLDASLATLATQPDAKSKDAMVGARARRDQLEAKLATMPRAAELGWTEYTKAVDTTFDAIEHDLRAAMH